MVLDWGLPFQRRIENPFKYLRRGFFAKKDLSLLRVTSKRFLPFLSLLRVTSKKFFPFFLSLLRVTSKKILPSFLSLLRVTSKKLVWFSLSLLRVTSKKFLLFFLSLLRVTSNRFFPFFLSILRVTLEHSAHSSRDFNAFLFEKILLALLVYIARYCDKVTLILPAGIHRGFEKNLLILQTILLYST